VNEDILAIRSGRQSCSSSSS